MSHRPTLPTDQAGLEEYAARLAEFDSANYGARQADDNHCECCGARGVVGRLCRTCEGSNP